MTISLVFIFTFWITSFLFGVYFIIRHWIIEGDEDGIVFILAPIVGAICGIVASVIYGIYHLIINLV